MLWILSIDARGVCALRVLLNILKLGHLALMSVVPSHARAGCSSTSLRRPGSPSSISTGWSSLSTEWGPGALAGKALVALGEKTLRSVENLILRKKLRAYKAYFPHNDEDGLSCLNVEDVYSEILEMSRCASPAVSNSFIALLIHPRTDLYSQGIRFRARKLLLKQIGRRKTSNLIRVLLEWPTEEIRLFLASVFEEMSIFW